MAAPVSERSALVFTAGGVRLALRLPLVREVLEVPPGTAEVDARGEAVPAVALAVALGVGGPGGRLALLTAASPPVALRIDGVHGIRDLGAAEVFQLPARTLLPQPPPFQGALVWGGDLALELALAAAGRAPVAPAPEIWRAPPEVDFPAGRELVFSRGERRYAVPLALLVRVLESPRVFPVPLAPRAHRGLLYHGRAIHPVFDIAALYDGRPAPGAALALIVDAGGTAAAFLADRIGGAGEGPLTRPAWDALFPA